MLQRRNDLLIAIWLWKKPPALRHVVIRKMKMPRGENELEFMLGADGLAELRTMARERAETTSDQSSDIDDGDLLIGGAFAIKRMIDAPGE
jgi:hypothetical protein